MQLICVVLRKCRQRWPRVARGKEPFLFSFLCSVLWKSRAFVKICFTFLSKPVEFDFGGKFGLKETFSLHTSFTRLNCNCQHSIEQKVLLTLKSFHTFKKMDPWILPHSERFLL